MLGRNADTEILAATSPQRAFPCRPLSLFVSASLEKNRRSLKITEALEDPYERSLFIKEPPTDFERFAGRLESLLKDTLEKIWPP